MVVKRTLAFEEEDKQVLQNFKAKIFTPICEASNCEECPFKNILCNELQNVIDDLIEQQEVLVTKI